MILVVDEFVNANPDVTVWLRAGWLNWVRLPAVLAQAGPGPALWVDGGSELLVTPPKPLDPTAPDLPSTVAARAFRGWVPPGTAVEVEVIAQRTATDASYGAGLFISPYSRFGEDRFPSGCQFAIIRADASILYNDLRLLGYQSVVTGPSENEEYPIDANHYLAGVGSFDPRHPSVPFSYALRLTNWQLPPNTRLLDIENWAFGNRPKGKSQTILLRDQSPLRDMLQPQESWAVEPFPSSPIQHVNIFIGDSVFIRERGLTDFRSAELVYLQKLKDDERALQLGAWGMFSAILMGFLKIGVAFTELEPWNKMALNFFLDETLGGGKVPFPP